jgi:hypothetical protein
MNSSLTAQALTLKLRVSGLWQINGAKTHGIIITRRVSEGFFQTLRQTQKHYPSLTQRVGIVANSRRQNTSARNLRSHCQKKQKHYLSLTQRVGIVANSRRQNTSARNLRSHCQKKQKHYPSLTQRVGIDANSRRQKTPARCNADSAVNDVRACREVAGSPQIAGISGAIHYLLSLSGVTSVVFQTPRS